MSEVFAGGCLCGAIRFTAAAPPVTAAFCHCPSCRRAAGAPVVAWAMFRREQLTVLRGTIAYYTSSPGVERGFCAACGTTLTWAADYLPGLIDITIGSLDDPARLPPLMHVWSDDRIDWLQLSDTLPRHAEFPPR